MKKIWFLIAVMICSAFAGNIFNSDGSINKNSEEYKTANETCINGCDYDDWVVSGDTVKFSLDGGIKTAWTESTDGNQFPEDRPLYVRLKSTIKTDHWLEKTRPSIPVAVKIIAENGFKYCMVSHGNGTFSWIKNGYEGVYNASFLGSNGGEENVTVLKLSSIKSGALTIKVIYLNKSLNRRYSRKYTVYIQPKK